MSKNISSMLYTVLLLACCILGSVGCAANWDLNKPNTLSSGDPACSIVGSKEKIWEAETSGGQPVGCAVQLKYRAPQSREAACAATLYWTKRDGTPGPGDGPLHGGDPLKPVMIPDAKVIELSCKGTSEDTDQKCHYEIDSVSCVNAGDAVNVINTGPMVNRTTVACGKPGTSIWTLPQAPAKNQSCNVTVTWSGTEHCPGIITARYPGNEIQSEAAPKRSMLKTFVGVSRLEFECKGTMSGENCTYTILSTECK